MRGYHYRLLASLEQWGPVSQANLSRDTGIDRSDVTAVLVDLEARELITRTVDPAHRRRKIVTITQSGCMTLNRLDAVLDGIQGEVLSPLSPTQQRQFMSIMVRLAAP